MGAAAQSLYLVECCQVANQEGKVKGKEFRMKPNRCDPEKKSRAAWGGGGVGVV